jgi:hypothetical protein
MKTEMAGQPPKYETPEQLEAKIKEYFLSFENELLKRPTLSGLALYLGFESRQSLVDNAERNPQFSYIIKAAVSQIAARMEAALEKSAGQVAGPVFWLKNHGWTDEQGLNVKGSLSLVDVAAKMGINE